MLRYTKLSIFYYTLLTRGMTVPSGLRNVVRNCEA
jgi:hypothetical protein